MTSSLLTPLTAPLAALHAPGAPRGPAYRLRLQTSVPQRAERRRLAELPHALTLAHDDVRAASLHALADLHIACTADTVWLTREGDPRDYVLDAGDQHSVRRGDALVLVGMPSGGLLISSSRDQGASSTPKAPSRGLVTR